MPIAPSDLAPHGTLPASMSPLETIATPGLWAGTVALVLALFLIDFAITHPPVCSSLSRSLLCPPADGRASGMTRCSVRTALTAPAAGARACLD